MCSHIPTLFLLQVITAAHDTPIQCIEYCPSREELATCAMGNKVKIWSFNSSKQPILTVMLDHQDPATAKKGASANRSPAGGARDVEGGPTDMQWLTRSDLDGLAPERPKLPDIVQQAIRTAGEDVPEVTQASQGLGGRA